MEAGKDVGAVMQAAAILRALSDAREPIGVTALARKAEVSPSTTLNILRTLVKERLVALDPSNKTYSLDLGLLELTRAMLGKTKIELLRPKMQRIANQYEATVSLWQVTDRQRLLLLDRVKPGVGVHIEFQIAMRIPLYAGANGRAVAAASNVSRDELHQAFANIRWVKPMTFEHYLAEIDEARERGYAIDTGALIKSVVSAAAVILDRDDKPAMVVSAHTFNGQLSDEILHELGSDISTTCADARVALFGRA
ncbi:IclR family transcriptional regulator [Paraburkholderia agricolaris]|uniref:IclR family transcriptional regulator n=1 Tax=Paraburkholderia agricolaris TaxID=2152888 RepID=UPI00142E9E73|nr:IclR family transcriptional regulator C-terminal domain-containing protein [Paraburkholderia agricolaris]